MIVKMILVAALFFTCNVVAKCVQGCVYIYLFIYLNLEKQTKDCFRIKG